MTSWIARWPARRQVIRRAACILLSLVAMKAGGVIRDPPAGGSPAESQRRNWIAFRHQPSRIAISTRPSQMGEILLQPQSARAAFCQLQPMARIASRDSASGRERPAARRGEAYARKLKETGVSVDAVRYSGAIHDFRLLNALRHAHSQRQLETSSRTSCNPTRYVKGPGYKPGPGLPID